jgi:phosphatidylglycerol:prolipoprotein diacylglycerol transferase
MFVVSAFITGPKGPTCPGYPLKDWLEIQAVPRVPAGCPSSAGSGREKGSAMRPVLATLLGVPISSYGVSKALAALVAALILARSFRRRGWPRDDAYAVVLAATVWGFIGAKLYYLAEHARTLMPHDFGMSGFTWYGGFIAGTVAVVVTARRHGLPLAELAGMTAVPLSVAYGIGRLGCLLAGDGTYGRPSNLPWAMAFPQGTVPTVVPVQPVPLYEALVSFALAGLLWWAQRRWPPLLVFAVYLVGSGTARLFMEILRINTQVLFGLTQPQLWSLVVVAVGVGLAWRTWRNPLPRSRQVAG